MFRPTLACCRRRGARPVVESLEGRQLMTAGALDPTFGGSGTVVTSVGTTTQNSNYSTGVAIQSDLKTVEVGGVTVSIKTKLHLEMVVTRLNPDGSLDTTFGGTGQVDLAINADNWSGWYPHMFSVAIQPDGKIVVAGDSKVTYQIGSGKKATTVTRADLLVARLNPNGSLDTTFNGTGEATLDFPQGDVYACGVAIQSSGAIVVAGSHDATGALGSSGNGLGFLAARWTPAGKLDTTFGPNGSGYVARPAGASSSLALDSSGDILIGGQDFDSTGGTPSALVRYTPNGLVDASFGNNGEVLFSSLPNSGDGVTGVGFQSAGQIVIDGGTWVARLEGGNGSLDSTFGAGGYFGGLNLIHSMGLAIQPDDQILVTGIPVQNGQLLSNAFAVDRVLSDGQSLDSSFGAGGQSLATFGATPDGSIYEPHAIALGPDGQVTVAGMVVDSSSHRSFGTARFRTS